jgi:23S rRNA pseudouridine2605 synthase
VDEKLQKVMARAGYGSRREIEQWIADGRIKIDKRIATLGDRVSSNDRIFLDGKLLRLRAPKRRVIIYHKPVGEVCTRRDPEGRDTIYTNLPRLSGARWIAVGRLDLNTSGLLVLTTDGELANRLMHPSGEFEREYAVRVLGTASDSTLKQLLDGVELDDGPARFTSIRAAGGEGVNQWYHVTLKEGRYREVRRLWEAVGFAVSRLTRVRFGPVSLPRGLRTGKWQELGPRELNSLLEAAGLERHRADERPLRKGARKKKPHVRRTARRR